MKRKFGSKGASRHPKESRDKIAPREGTSLTFEASGPSPEEIVGRFLSVKGKKLRKLVDWKSIVDGEYKGPESG